LPIHIRAEPGEYAEACLLPGDPLRAKYIAETYLDQVQQRNSERGLLGYTGEWEGSLSRCRGRGWAVRARRLSSRSSSSSASRSCSASGPAAASSRITS